jgi:hypothetical protein
VDRRGRGAGVRALLQRHWTDWMAPVTIELAAAGIWEQSIDAAIGQALTPTG